MDPIRRPDEALAVGILADLEQDLADRLLDRAVRRRRATAVPTIGRSALLLGGRGLVDAVLVLADLGLDLGDELADVVGQVELMAPGIVPRRRVRPVGRPAAPRSHATAFCAEVGTW